MKDHQIQVQFGTQKRTKWELFIMEITSHFEMGRVEWLRNKGVSYSMEENGIALP
jgi:acyl-CoA thioester hydrolase